MPDAINHFIDGAEVAGSSGRSTAVGGTLFDHITTDMEIYTEEIFGHVLAVGIRWNPRGKSL